jgi:protein-tyrosine-phosphatase
MSPARDLPDAVLFACNLNAVRSPMAAGIMRSLFGKRVYVDSVGVRPGDLDPFAVVVMDEVDIDISEHQAKSFAQLEDTLFDIIISLTPEAHHNAVELTRTMAVEAEYWPTKDPTAFVGGSREQILHAYREVRDALIERIQKRFSADGTPNP